MYDVDVALRTSFQHVFGATRLVEPPKLELIG
jgi:hypothetical protein